MHRRHTSRSLIICEAENRVLSFNELSFSSRDWMTLSALSIGTEVNNAVTSYERSSSSSSTRSLFMDSANVCELATWCILLPTRGDIM